MENPAVGKAIPRIPGKTVREVNGSRDISTLSVKGGFIFIGSAPKTSSSIETLFQVNEKLRILVEASNTGSRLFTQVLGIESKEELATMADIIRGIRNRTAHPTPFRILEGDVDFSLVPRKYQAFARILVAWTNPLRA
jgi:hypothetical protein